MLANAAIAVLLLVAPAAGVAAPAPPRASAAVSAEARALAESASMTSAARALYVGTRPTVDDRAMFPTHCPALEAPGTYVLGCYRPGPRRIHLLRIERPDLLIGMPVTAAHEMLHAAYESLGRAARRRIDALTQKVASAIADPTLEAELSAYPAREHSGELHSRLGTEIATLPRSLERYYARYFRDRGVVVAAAAAYQHVFDELEDQITHVNGEIDATVRQLDDLRPRLDAANTEALRLSSEIRGLRAQGRIAESNALVGSQNTAVAHANALTDEYNAIVAAHNQLVESYNALLLTNEQLVASLEPLPTPT